MHELKDSLKRFADFEVDNEHKAVASLDKVANLQRLNEKLVSVAASAQVAETQGASKTPTNAIAPNVVIPNHPDRGDTNCPTPVQADALNLDVSKQTGHLHVSYEDVKRELRHKYLVILKSCYWHFFEDGQCMSDSVEILIESADRCMDDESHELCDFDFISGFLSSAWYLDVLARLINVPLLGRLAHSALFEHHFQSYDILISFIEAHDETKRLMMNVMEGNRFIDEILHESHEQVRHAEKYMHKHIEYDFPEVCKALQHRRAMYYLLVHEYHFLEDMHKHGQIEERDAETLRVTLEAKIFDLTLHAPAIEMLGWRDRIHKSNLSYVFSEEELDKALEAETLEGAEQAFNPSTALMRKGERSALNRKILFVARGNIVEKDGELEARHEPHLRYKRGNYAGLQNLLPHHSHEDDQSSDVYAYHTSMAEVIPLDLEHLRSILAADFERLEVFWHVICYRMLVINSHRLEQFHLLTQDHLKKFCHLCELKLYRPGVKINVANGGVILHGSMQLLVDEGAKGPGLNPERIESVHFVKPERADYVGFGDRDYIAYLHFADCFVDDMRSGRVTNEKVRKAVAEGRRTARQTDFVKSHQRGREKSSEKKLGEALADLEHLEDGDSSSESEKAAGGINALVKEHPLEVEAEEEKKAI
jgi:hypothetical protein